MNSAFAASFGSPAHAEIFDCTKRRRGCALITRKFSRLAVERSSMTTTVLPSASRRSTRWEPIKPAPPVTKTNEDGGWKIEDGMGFSEHGGWKMEDGRSRGVFTKIVRAFDHFVYAGPD